jgi:hypothetical protein
VSRAKKADERSGRNNGVAFAKNNSFIYSVVARTRDGIEESGKTGEKRAGDWTLTVPCLFFIRRRRRRSDLLPLFLVLRALYESAGRPS